MNKTIFITGASSGIGKAAAKLFASKGWTVIATMRNPSKETELTVIDNIKIMPLDVNSLEQITEIVQETVTAYDVDIVLNNAGYGLSGALDALTDEQIIRQLNTNLLGLIKVTKEFIPFLKQKRSGRIINLTSMAGIVSFPFDSIYNASKWAVEGITQSIYFELLQYNIKAKTIAPGVVLTDFGIRSLDKAPLASEYEELSKNFIHYMMQDMSLLSSAELIADKIYEAATDDKDQIRYVVGIDANAMYTQYLELGIEGFRKKLMKELTKSQK